MGLHCRNHQKNISKKEESGQLKESRVNAKKISLNSGIRTQAKTSSMNAVIRMVWMITK